MKYFSIAIFLLCFNCNLFSQTSSWYKKRDSVLKLLSLNNNDVSSSRQLMFVGKLYLNTNQDSAIYYFTLAKALGEKNKDFEIIVDYYNNTSTAFLRKGIIDSAINYATQGLEYAKKTNKPAFEEASYMHLGGPYLEKGDYKKAAEYYLEAEKLCRLTADSTARYGDVYSLLTLSYNNLKDYTNAYKYGMKAVSLARKLNQKNVEINALINLGGTLIYTQKFDSALLVFKDAESAALLINEKYNLDLVYTDLIYIYERLGKYEMIKPIVEKQMANSIAINDHEGVTRALLSYSDYYFYKKDYSSARKYALMSLDSIKHYGINQYLKNNYLGLSQIAIGLGNFKEFEYYGNLRDSVEDAQQSMEILNETKDLEKKYETEKKDAQIKLQQANLQQERIWKIVLAGLVVLLLLTGFFAIRSYRNKHKLLLKDKELQQQKIIQLENEKQLAATQAILQGQEEERKRLAKDLHDGLGGVLSGVKYSFNNMKQQFVLSEENAKAFEKSMTMLDDSITELRRVAHNMMPESLMKLSLNEALQDYCNQVTQNSSLKVSYHSVGFEEKDPDNTTKTTVYRIIQELINNIIKHADANSAIVQVITRENLIDITVEDNGKGFDVNKLSYAEGIGYKNTRSRVDYLKGKMDIQSKIGEGTSVFIEIPYNS